MWSGAYEVLSEVRVSANEMYDRSTARRRRLLRGHRPDYVYTHDYRFERALWT